MTHPEQGDRRMNLLFGVHCHQPVGNFGFVFEKAYQQSYLPFFQLLSSYPNVKMVAHFSGCLLDWIFDHHPEFIAVLKTLTARGQLEMLGGGYYEPILSVLPERDRKAQLVLMNKVLKRTFGQAPHGLWLAERVWEPDLPAPLADAGIRAVFLDDSHFLAAGKMPHEIHGCFTTDHLDRELRIFPISEKLRYLIPFAPVEEVFAWLAREAERIPGGLLTMVDDGEKFGIWPQTWDWVYGRKWLETFFEHLGAADWVRTVTLHEALSLGKDQGVVHLPTLSYREMGEWVLPLEAARLYHKLESEVRPRSDFDAIKPFVRGGYWRNFFDKYSESRWMYRRMILASSRVQEKDAGYTDLLRAQCNCGYWHGIFGGLYLPFLRREVFSRLIRAEHGLKSRPWTETPIGWEARTATWQVFVGAEAGGAIEELDLRPHAQDLFCTLRRRIEFYHGQAGAKGDDHASIHDMGHAMPPEFLEDIRDDPHPRKGLIVHQFSRIPESLNEAEALDAWKWFDETAHVSVRGGTLKASVRRGEWTLTKILRLDGSSLKAELAWNREPASVWSAELPFSPADGYWKAGAETEPRPLDRPASFETLDHITLFDTATGAVVEVRWDAAVPVRVFPLRTVSMSESGYERIQQGLIVLPMFTGKTARLHLIHREDLHV
jgi:hypothetical protein